MMTDAMIAFGICRRYRNVDWPPAADAIADTACPSTDSPPIALDRLVAIMTPVMAEAISSGALARIPRPTVQALRASPVEQATLRAAEAAILVAAMQARWRLTLRRKGLYS